MAQTVLEFVQTNYIGVFFFFLSFVFVLFLTLMSLLPPCRCVLFLWLLSLHVPMTARAPGSAADEGSSQAFQGAPIRTIKCRGREGALLVSFRSWYTSLFLFLSSSVCLCLSLFPLPSPPLPLSPYPAATALLLLRQFHDVLCHVHVEVEVGSCTCFPGFSEIP